MEEYYEHGCYNVLNFAIRRFFSGYGLLTIMCVLHVYKAAFPFIRIFIRRTLARVTHSDQSISNVGVLFVKLIKVSVGTKGRAA